MIDLFSCSYLLRKKIEIQYNNNMIKIFETTRRIKRSQDQELAIHVFPTPHVRVFIACFKKYIFRQGSYVHRAVGGWCGIS